MQILKKKKLRVKSIRMTFLHQESGGTWSRQIHTTAETLLTNKKDSIREDCQIILFSTKQQTTPMNGNSETLILLTDYVRHLIKQFHPNYGTDYREFGLTLSRTCIFSQCSIHLSLPGYWPVTAYLRLTATGSTHI